MEQNKTIFSKETTLDILRHEDGQYYTIQHENGNDYLVSIDKMIDALYASGKIEPKRYPARVVYNGNSYESEHEIKYEITQEDVYLLLNSGLVSFTEVEPVKE